MKNQKVSLTKHVSTKNMAVENDLYQAILTLKTVAEIKLFMQDLCTPNETQALADRWHVVPAIKAGKSYRQIYEETGVSVTTIGRVARCLLLGTGGYDLAYERINKKHKKI